MRKIVLAVIAFLFVNVQAEDELIRKFLEVKKSDDFVSLPLKFYKQDVHFKYIVSSDKESLAIVIPSRKSNSEKEYFTSLTVSIRWVLKNYKFSKIPQNDILFALDGDAKVYPYVFAISKNNLRLLDNRDFGPKDMMSFNDNGGLVYPIKLILRRGEFRGEGKELENIKRRYSKFLETFDISPLNRRYCRIMV